MQDETKRARIAALLDAGVSTRDISQALGVTTGHVNATKAHLRGYIRPEYAARREELRLARAVAAARAAETPDWIDLGGGKKARISPEDFPLVSKFKWYANRHCGGRLYAIATNKKSEGGDGKLMSMHRLILGFPKTDVDHRNGDGLDNRRENIRHASPRQNGFNKHMGSSGTIYTGVYFYKNTKKWTGQVTDTLGRRHSIGYHKCDWEAALAREVIVKTLQGEFAKLNFPPELVDVAYLPPKPHDKRLTA